MPAVCGARGAETLPVEVRVIHAVLVVLARSARTVNRARESGHVGDAFGDVRQVGAVKELGEGAKARAHRDRARSG